MKKSKKVALIVTPVLSALLFSACQSDEPDATRDVYQSKEECLKDWGDDELCPEMDSNDAKTYRSGGGVFFWGPLYYPGSRSVYYKGKTVTPTGKSSTLSPYTVTSRSSASSRSGASSPVRSSSSSSYGGFGGSKSSGSGS